MKENEYQSLVDTIEKRIGELNKLIASDASVASRKQAQSDDAAANLDLTINSPVSETVASNHRREIAELSRNLNWLKSEDGGYCEHCGCEIPVARLQAVPSTRLCVSCGEQAQAQA